MESLADKLRSLGMARGVNQITTPRVTNRFPLSDVLKVENRRTIFGDCIFVKNIYPVDYQHGIVNFSSPIDYSILLDWGKLETYAQIPINQFLFFDTETTGLAGGTGTFAFMVGFGYWAENLDFHLIQMFLPEPVEEPALLAGFDEFVDPFKVIVSFNGKSFDAPLLNTRHILNSIRPPFTKKGHLDLLHLARRLWKNRLPSRSLGDLEREILNYSRGEDEIPGWMVPELYTEYLNTGDARPLKGVFYHNEIDILSLAALFKHMSQVLQNPIDTLDSGLDLIAVARLYEDLNQHDIAISIYEKGLNSELPKELFLQALLRDARLFFRQGDYQKGIQIYKKAAELQSISACEELAKYFEHRQNDYSMALFWTDRGLDLIYEQSTGAPLQAENLTKGWMHRKARLQAKLSKEM